VRNFARAAQGWDDLSQKPACVLALHPVVTTNAGRSGHAAKDTTTGAPREPGDRRQKDHQDVQSRSPWLRFLADHLRDGCDPPATGARDLSAPIRYGDAFPSQGNSIQSPDGGSLFESTSSMDGCFVAVSTGFSFQQHLPSCPSARLERLVPVLRIVDANVLPLDRVHASAPFGQSYAIVLSQIIVQLGSRGKSAALIDLQEAIEVGGLLAGKGILSHADVRFDLELGLLCRRLKRHQQHGRMTCAGQISDQSGR
jgi:hypothetical protein